MSFRLRFPASEIGLWAGRFPVDVDRAVEKVAPGIRKRGYLRRSEFLALCAWKTPRTAPRCASNSAALIQDATKLAFATADERAKIGILRLLAGVDWPTASVLLHFADRRPYPILDTRALWSLGVTVTGRYDFDFWLRYTLFLRGLARRNTPRNARKRGAPRNTARNGAARGARWPRSSTSRSSARSTSTASPTC